MAQRVKLVSAQHSNLRIYFDWHKALLKDIGRSKVAERWSQNDGTSNCSSFCPHRPANSVVLPVCQRTELGGDISRALRIRYADRQV